MNKVVEATSSARALTEARDSALDKSAAHRGTQAEEDTRPSSASPAMEQVLTSPFTCFTGTVTGTKVHILTLSEELCAAAALEDWE